MGCGCKSKPVPQTNFAPIQVQQVPTVETVNYTREELNRALNYINGGDQSPTERTWLYNFHNQHNNEQLIPSCHQCYPRVQARIIDMDTKLRQIEAQ
jgi:hypothetical protein